MKKLGLIFVALLFICATTDKITDCTYKGKKLYGRVRVVDAHTVPDFRVRIVKDGEDLRVKVRPDEHAYPADRCGEWKFVESGADFTVQFVEYSEDFTIKFVDY